MDRLASLKAKYAKVIDFAKANNVRIDHLHLEGDKLLLQGAAPSDKQKNRVWDVIKEVDPMYGDLTVDLNIDSSIPEPIKTYTVKPNDSLWKIAQDLLGNGSLYPKLIAANSSKLKDEKSVIHPGDVLVIPEA
jgi:nucleoid-associated protein YgaU